jgi:hypothetical protein
VRLNARLAVHVPAADRPSGAFCWGAVASASIVVEGEPVEFQVHTVGRRWLGYGLWRGFAVELEGSGIQPADVALQLADVGPAGHPRR